MAEFPEPGREAQSHPTPALAEHLWDDFEAERRETIRRHAPVAIVVILTFVFVFAVIVWQRRPEHRTSLLVADALFVLVSVVSVMAARAMPRFTVAITVVSINAYTACMQIYEVLVRGSIEMTVMGTMLLLGGVVAILPLGTRNFLLSSVCAVVAFPLTLEMGARTLLDPWYSIAALAACVTAMATGAGTIERYRLRILQHSAEQARLAAANSRLMVAAEAAHEEKSEFLATVAHELRNPLGVIIGYGDLLREGAFPDAESMDDAHGRIVAQAVDMLDMLQNLLDADKAASGTLRLELNELDLSQFLTRLRSELPPSWTKPGVEIAWILPSTPLPVTTDARKLKAILHNLLHNAIKYTARGQVTVAALEAADGVELSVADTGEGIPAADLPFVFERFRQSGNPTRAGGVGLGLHIVKRFSEALGGSIAAESTVGQGSRFVLTLPRSSH